MRIQETKEILKRIIESLNYEDDFERSLLKMVEEYEGENPTEFFESFSQLLVLLAEHNKLSVKAKAYDRIMQIENEYTQNLKNLTNEYEFAKNMESTENIMPVSTSE